MIEKCESIEMEVIINDALLKIGELCSVIPNKCVFLDEKDIFILGGPETSGNWPLYDLAEERRMLNQFEMELMALKDKNERGGY